MPHTSDLRRAFTHSWNGGSDKVSGFLLGAGFLAFLGCTQLHIGEGGTEETETSKRILPPRTFPTPTSTKSQVLKSPLHSHRRGIYSAINIALKKNLTNLFCVEAFVYPHELVGVCSFLLSFVMWVSGMELRSLGDKHLHPHGGTSGP